MNIYNAHLINQVRMAAAALWVKKVGCRSRKL